MLAGGQAEKSAPARGMPWSPEVPDTLHDSLMARLDQLASAKDSRADRRGNRTGVRFRRTRGSRPVTARGCPHGGG